MIPIDQGLLDFRSPGESMFSHELRMPYIYIYIHIGYHLTNLDSLIVCFGDVSTVTVCIYQVSFKFHFGEMIGLGGFFFEKLLHSITSAGGGICCR